MTLALTSALTSFHKDLDRHGIFLILEAKIKNPASARSRPRSETLLSAFVSLSCGRFEGFLQQAFYHAADDLRQRITVANDPRILKVDKFYWQNLNGFVKWAAAAKGIDRNDMIAQIIAFASTVARGHIYPESFQYTNSNPNSATVREMLSRFGIDDGFNKVANAYLDTRGRRFTSNLIETTLSGFVQRRHQAAHNGRIPGMTRTDAQDDLVFIAALASALKTVLSTHVASII